MKYYIYSQNRFNQILIFDTYEGAYNWCKSSTIWTDEEIKENIKTPKKQGNYSFIIEGV